jgi:hypothetical protein
MIVVEAGHVHVMNPEVSSCFVPNLTRICIK